MFYELGKKSFKITKNLINLVRVIAVFFTFFMIAYWIFEIAGATFIQGLTPFFDSLKAFIHLYYDRGTTVDSVELDYSFLVFAIFLLIIVWILKFVVEMIEDAEKKYDSIHRSIKHKTQEVFNTNLEKSYMKMENKNNNFAIIVKFNAKNLAKDVFYTRDAEDGTEEKQKAILDDFLTEITKSLLFQKRVMGDGVILFFHSVKNIDKIISEVTKNISKIRTKYKEEKWSVDFLSGIETYSDEKEAMNKCRTLIMLIKLNLKNELLCLSTFKQRYSLLSHQRFFIESKGVYNINGEEDVFTLKSTEKQ